MNKNLHPSKKIYFFLIMLLSLLPGINNVKAQTPGLIIKPASSPGNSVLDPDGDGYVSQKTNGIQLGFTIPPNNDVSQSEIPYVPIVRPDPLGDLLRGPVGGYSEIVGVDAAGNNAILTYNDGTNLLFRFRLGGYAPNSKSYSILIDTDGKFGFTGPNADPNAVPGNPGFEVEIVLETNFNVKAFNVDGITTLGTPVASYSYDTNCQKSVAVSVAGGDPDYFYDFYLPLSSLSSLFTSSTPLRIVAVTVMNPDGAIGSNSLSDVGGVGAVSSLDQAFVNLIDAQTPTVPGSEVLDRTACPTITLSYTAASTTVTGTSTEANGTVIQVFINGSPAGATVTVSGGTWSRSGLTLAATNVITATATAPGKGTSFANCSSKTVTVTACSTAPPTAMLSANSGKNISVTFTLVTAGTKTITVYNGDGTIWQTGTSTSITAGIVLSLTNGTPITSNGSKAPNGTYYATVTFGGCESTRLEYCIAGSPTSAAPTITSPIAVGATSVSGTGGVAGSFIIVYADGIQIATTSVAAASWSVTVPALTNCQQITAKQVKVSVNGAADTGTCLSVASNVVTVSHTAAKPIITSTGCNTSLGTISGSSTEADGTIVTLYNMNPSRVSLGTATVASGGWSVSGLTLASGNILVAAVTSGACLTASVDSDPVTISIQTSLTGYTIGVTAPTEGQTSVSGTISGGSYPVTLKIYEDETLVGSGVSIASAGAWTVSSGILNTDLYVGGKLKVTLTYGTGCESVLSAELATVQCISPAMPTYTGGSMSYCYGGAGQLTLTTSQTGVIYQLVNGSGVTVGPASIGTGSGITLYTNALVADLLTIYVKAYKIAYSSCSATSSTVINFTLQNPSPTVSFTSTSLSIPRGPATTLNFPYTAKSTNPPDPFTADKYTIAYSVAAKAQGFVDQAQNTIPVSPILLNIPNNPAEGTYTGTIKIEASSGSSCSTSYGFTITVYGASSSPVISSQPANITICSGGTTTLSVTASSATTISYQWQSSSSYSGTYTNVGTNSSSYTPAALASTTYYRVLVTNANGTKTSNVATVTVNAAPAVGNFSVSAASAYAGNSSVVTVSSTSLVTGNYTVTYNITGTNTVSSTTATMSFTAGIPGTGSFTTPNLTNAGVSNLLSITAIAYTSTLTCSSPLVSKTSTFATNPANTAGSPTSTPTLCINTALTNITHTTSGATGISNSGVSGANGLPAGVSATFASNTITISGTPIAAGVFAYSIPLTGGYGSVNATGSITVIAPTAPTANNVTVVYNGASQSASASVASGETVNWYTAASGGSATTAPTGTNVNTYTAWAEARNTTTGCVSSTRTQVTLTITSGIPDATQSTLTPTSASIIANGSSTQVLTVQAKDDSGTNISTGGATVTITKSSGTGTIGAVTDNSNGTYTATVTSPTSTGSGVFVATLGGAAVKSGTGSQTQSTITYIPGAATQITINAGDGQSATAGSAVAILPSVIVKDVNNNVVSGVSVTFTIATGGGSATGLSATTDASGIATVGSWTLGATAGSNTLSATSAGLTGSPVTFTATGTVGAASQIAVNAGNNQSATVSTDVATPPRVIVKDANNNPVSGKSVTFAVATGGGSATGLSATTDASGIATVGSWTLGAAAGSNTLTATSTGLTGSPVTFTATGTAGITYYLTAAGAGAAQTATNWNTIAGGGGTPAPNFTTAGSIFNIPLGINGVVSGNWIFGNSGNAAALTLTINGQLTINSGNTLTLSQKNSGTNSMTVNGTLTFSDASANQLAGTSSGSGSAANNTFVLASGATLKTANANGIVNPGIPTPGSINPSTITTTLNTAANYEFNGAAQTTTGLPATVNNLTLSGSGAKTLTALTNINGNFTISGTASTTATAALPIGGDVTLGSGSSFTAGSYTHNVGGDWTNNGATFTSTGSTINFNGSGAITIGGSSSTTFNNLFIGKLSGSVTLGADVNVVGILKATTGTLASAGHLTLVSTPSQTALVDGSGAGSITGNVTMKRFLSSAFGYKYFGSPFNDATVAQFSSYLSTTATIPTFYFYNEDHNNSGAYMTGWTTYPAGTLSPMIGYAANLGAGVASNTITLAGTVNNSSYSLALYNNNRTYTQGFNLVGNPYPSPINWNAASGWTKTNMDNALYFFDSTGASDEYSGNYSSYVNGVSTGGSNNIIPSMQGFFVHVSDVPLPYPISGTLGISNSVRTTDLNPAFKSAFIDPRTILRFAASFDGKSSLDDAMVLYFDPTATTKFDKNADALKMMNTDIQVPNLYTITSDNRQVSINGMPFPTDSITRIPLGITTYRDSWVSIEAKEIGQLPSAMNLYLLDNESHINQDLKNSPNYKFYLKKGEYNQRFTLVFSTAKQPLPPYETDKLFVLTRAGGKLLVYLNLGAGETGKLSLFNLLGQKILEEEEVTDQQTLDISSGMPTGVYIITVKAGNRSHSEKTIIRKE